MVALAVVAAAFVGNGTAKPSPTHVNARDQLPAQASDRANPPSKTLDVLPPPPVIPSPLPAIPEVVSLFTFGQSNVQQQAAAAINSATTTVKTRIANAPRVSIITMTATQTSLERTRFAPSGRAGDLEVTTWRFNDRYGRKIGTGTLACRWANEFRRLCWGEARLPRGKLALLGTSTTRVRGEFAVVGGTGVYLFQQGLLTFTATGHNKFAVRVLLA